VDAGGTITGEHGVGLDKLAYMPLVFGPDELGLMAACAASSTGGIGQPGRSSHGTVPRVETVERRVSGPIRSLAVQMDAQIADAERQAAAADRHLARLGARAIEEAYPGVMAVAIVQGVAARPSRGTPSVPHQDLGRLMAR